MKFGLFLSLTMLFSVAVNAYFLIHHWRAASSPPSSFSQKTLYQSKCNRYQKLPVSPCRFLFLGDSIPNLLVADLEDKRNEGDLQKGWGEPPAGDFRNRCISGVTTQGLDEMLAKTLLPKAQTVFVWIGINDLSHGRTPSDVEINYRNILQKVRRSEERDARLILISVLPTSNGIPHINSLVDDLNTRLQSLAKEFKGEYVNVRGAVTSNAGIIDPSYTWDGTHPNPEGLTRIEDVLLP